MSSLTSTRSGAEEFVVRLMDDGTLYDRVESAAGVDLLPAAVMAGKELGFEFTADQLEEAITAGLGLEELELSHNLRPPQTKSGCRTPCLYCNVVEVEEN